MSTVKKATWKTRILKCALVLCTVAAFVVNPLLATAAGAATAVGYACRKRGYPVNCTTVPGACVPSKAEVMRSWVALF